MKASSVINSISYVFILILSSCSGLQLPKENPAELIQKNIDEETHLAAFLSGMDSTMYIKPDQKDEILKFLEAEKISVSYFSSSKILSSGKNYSFNIVESAHPYLFKFDIYDLSWSRLDSIGCWNFNFYSNSECEKVHPGFWSDCYGTPKGKRGLGQSMSWTVRTWKSCRPGKGICIETEQVVGEITYFQGPKCFPPTDTLTVLPTEPIIRSACQ